MSETPTSGAVGAGGTGGTTGAAGSASAGTAGDVNAGATGNPADAGATDSNPTDSSSVSDEQGVQPEKAEELRTTDEPTEVEHEGTGPGDEPAPASDVEEPDGTDNA